MREANPSIGLKTREEGGGMLSDGRIKRVGWARKLWMIIDLMSKIFVYWNFELFEDNATTRVSAGPCLPTRLIRQLSP